jgi:hypothetical protein
MTEAIFRERLQAIIDWADLAMKNRAEFDSHGVRNLDGPVFDAAREALASTSPPKTNPIGYISRDTFAELLHDNSGEYKIVTPEDLIMVEGSIADYVPIFSLPGAHPSDPPPQDHLRGYVETVRAALKPFADLHSEIPEDNFWPSEEYKNLSLAAKAYAITPPVLNVQDIRNAGLKARDKVLERMADGGTVDNDLADYMSHIVEECIRAALTTEGSDNA